MSGSTGGTGTTVGTDQISVAAWLARELYDRARWIPEVGGWAYRSAANDWRWEVGGTARAKVRADVTLLVLAHAATFTTGRTGATMRAMGWIDAVERGMWQAHPQMHRAMGKWDEIGHALQTPDGVFDMTYGLLRPTGLGDFNLCSTAVTPVAGPCDAIDRFLDESFRGDVKLIEFIETFYGVALRGNVELQQALMLVGAGRSGKSTLVALMRRIAGDYACKLNDNAFVDTTYANGRDYAMATLVGKRLAIASEVRAGAVLDEAAFKRLVGGDEVQARKPGGMPFSFVPVATTIMAMNDFPVLKSGGEAMRRRMLVVTMNHEVAKEDPMLLETMALEGPHWLWRCLDRARQQYLLGMPAVPQDVTDNVAVVVEGVDPIDAWWRECGVVTNAPTDKVWVDEVHPQVAAWCVKSGRGMLPLTEKQVQFQFRQMLDRKSNGVLGKSVRVQEKDKRGQAFIGIRLRTTHGTNGAFGSL